MIEDVDLDLTAMFQLARPKINEVFTPRGVLVNSVMYIDRPHHEQDRDGHRYRWHEPEAQDRRCPSVSPSEG